MDNEQTRRTLEAVAGWRRLMTECPYCETCRREMASLAATIPPVMVRDAGGAYEHLTGEAIAAFFAVLNKYGSLSPQSALPSVDSET